MAPDALPAPNGKPKRIAALTTAYFRYSHADEYVTLAVLPRRCLEEPLQVDGICGIREVGQLLDHVRGTRLRHPRTFSRVVCADSSILSASSHRVPCSATGRQTTLEDSQ